MGTGTFFFPHPPPSRTTKFKTAQNHTIPLAHSAFSMKTLQVIASSVKQRKKELRCKQGRENAMDGGGGVICAPNSSQVPTDLFVLMIGKGGSHNRSEKTQGGGVVRGTATQGLP